MRSFSFQARPHTRSAVRRTLVARPGEKCGSGLLLRHFRTLAPNERRRPKGRLERLPFLLLCLSDIPRSVRIFIRVWSLASGGVFGILGGSSCLRAAREKRMEQVGRRFSWGGLPLIAMVARLRSVGATYPPTTIHRSRQGRSGGARWPRQYGGRAPTASTDCQEPQVALQMMAGRSSPTSFRLERD